MNAEDVRACLALHWPDNECLSIEEAPEDSSRAGRKIDLLVLGLWRSRGLGLDAVEIKVSMSDWVRERLRGEKADFWWRHSNRFWVACPTFIAEKVREDLPETWGLLSCEFDKKPKVLVKAAHREREPMEWGTIVGCLRAAANCGVNALARAEQRGREEGRRRAEENGPDQYVREQLRRLEENIASFKAITGVDLTNGWTLGDQSRLVKMMLDQCRNRPVSDALRRQAEQLRMSVGVAGRYADDLDAIASALEQATA